MNSDWRKNPSLGVPFPSLTGKGNQSMGLTDKGVAINDIPMMAAGFKTDQKNQAGLGQPTDIRAHEHTSTRILVESIIKEPNFLPAWFLRVGSGQAQSICKIETSGTNYEGRFGSWCGTGFLVAKDILLTNHHVLNSREVASGALCIFGYEQDVDGSQTPTKAFRLVPDRLFLTSPVEELDFTFVAIDGEPGNEFGFIHLDRAYFKIFDGECANIIQHPNGEYKSVVLQENRVVSQDEVHLNYLSDTQGGSSGSCVFNNLWKAAALHHASRPATDEEAKGQDGIAYVNRGVKLSAIAARLENLAHDNGPQAETAGRLLSLFGGIDSAMGFFGGLGRVKERESGGLETVVQSYYGEDTDIDVGFWNVEWFNRHPEKADDIARAIADMNLDIWAFEESSLESTEKLVGVLASKYGLLFDYAASEEAPKDKQITTVIWNKKSVDGEPQKWPEVFEPWFKVRSQDFDKLGLEAVEGKVFDRYPGLFYFKSKPYKDHNSIDFYLVPLHLKAMEEGSKRRIMAARILGAAVAKMINEFGNDTDWILGGDFNAELATKDFQALMGQAMTAISAADEAEGAFSYLKRPKSLIDHIFLSANLAKTYDSADFFIVAKEKTIPDYLKKFSDHRPVLARLSLATLTTKPESSIQNIPQDLASVLSVLPSLQTGV
ncbi:MAG: trypsin-like peptidase domain-containing protein [Desulfomonile tiedjei]|uniref:Trypsin-like peptidase domain-containing protein n=1 Tax=Desulfomonile tiedjei TaxID=2358 RepID=A0A9D6UYE1_9BACT|nr:trypsin-like peptidase domain-containing protein [Desulfomonile tiedjei]